MQKTAEQHIEAIQQLVNEKNVLLIDAVAHYTEYNSLDPYFIADIVRNDKEIFTQLLTEGKQLNLTK